jgi:xanthine dehydrogenase accessory factor
MTDYLRQAAALQAKGTPFVLATVVWRRGPSSGQAGSKAIITADGKMHGWLGGACAGPTVVSQALESLGDGRPRLLQLGPPEEFGRTDAAGVVSVPMACESEGAMEVYLEPELPETRLVVIGGSPAAVGLVRMGEVLGWRAALIHDGGAAGDFPAVPEFHPSLDLAQLGVTGRDFIVVATQGHYDEQALEAALRTSAGYVGLIASPKRADSVLEFLRSQGTADEALARVHAPAGLDLGSLPHEEIAVSVLAELVALKAKGGIAPGVAIAPPEVAIDPICGMKVEVASAHFSTQHEGTTYYFCAAGCLKAFEADPAAFI